MIKTLVLPVFLVLFITSVLGGAIGGVLPIGGFFQSPIAHIQLPAEAIPGLGIYNTSLTFWVSILVLLSFVFLSTRNLKKIPEGRLQNLAEVVVEFFLNLAKSISGSEKGRRFVPVVLSIFLCVVVSNWVGVLPGVGTIGIVESAEVVYEHKKHKLDTDDCHGSGHGSDHGSDHGSEKKEFTCKKALKEHLVIFDNAFMGIKYLPPGRGESSVEEGGGVVLVKDVIKNDSLIVEGEHEGKKAGRLLPLFRGANTDLNTPLAIAIFVIIVVQFWGFKALGFKSYAGKFFVNPISLLKLYGEVLVGWSSERM